jgi:radical SAM superfamily enzyme YgiQ (UPF0313 family)
MEKNKKTLVICNFPRTSEAIWFPILWINAKTYYERNGKNVDDWYWHPCYFDMYSGENIETIKNMLLEAKPDIFAISLYVWNYKLSHDVAAWVKQTFPKCLVITGGPHQYVKHDLDWFKKHKYIDASLPGECYGELAFQEILDNYQDGKVEWSKITDIRYPKGKNRHITASPLSMHRSSKKYYDFDFSAYDAQIEELKKFNQYYTSITSKTQLLAMLETTRGCPYGCTYCDWGGGTSTTVIKKSVESVQKEIDGLSNFNLKLLYICDANFGIFGERDVEIIKYIADSKMANGYNFQVLYGGYAKTENKLEYIKQIVQFDMEHNLSFTDEVKLSLQSIDPEVLKNIDRVNIPLDKQMEVYKPIAQKNKVPFYIEIIMGLPGMTLDKFYAECDVYGGYEMAMQWFQWILMPETPAYDKSYREKFGLEFVTKTYGWQMIEPDSHYDIVIGAKSYSKTDYLQMLLSTSLYNLLIQGGYYKNTFKWVMENHQLKTGQIIRDIFENFFMKDESCEQFKDLVFQDWNKIINDTTSPAIVRIDDKNSVYGGYYFVGLAFLYHETFTKKLIDWIQLKYSVPRGIIVSDEEVTVHVNNFNTIKWKNLVAFDSKKPVSKLEKYYGSALDLLVDFMYRTYRDTGTISRGKKRLFGIIPLK